VLRFSGPLATFSAVNYWARNSDNLLIGRFVGAVGLAFYARAYQLMTVTSQQPSTILGRVLFPALSSMGDDLARIARAWRRALGVIAAVAFPLSLGLAACAPTALDALFGRRWTAAGDTVRYLALVGCMQCLVTTIGWIFQSRGATRKMARVGLVSNAVCIASFFAGVHWGIAGVAAAYAAANAATFYYELHAATTLLDVSVGSLLRPLATTFTAAAAMGGIVFAVDHFTRTSVSAVPTLALDVAAGAIVYALLLAILRPAAVADIRQTLATLRARGNAPGAA
jgi:PST family polysaccharide transporter